LATALSTALAVVVGLEVGGLTSPSSSELKATRFLAAALAMEADELPKMTSTSSSSSMIVLLRLFGTALTLEAEMVAGFLALAKTSS